MLILKAVGLALAETLALAGVCVWVNSLIGLDDPWRTRAVISGPFIFVYFLIGDYTWLMRRKAEREALTNLIAKFKTPTPQQAELMRKWDAARPPC